MSMNRVFSSVFLAVMILALTVDSGTKAFPLDHNDTPGSVKRDVASILDKVINIPAQITRPMDYEPSTSPTKLKPVQNSTEAPPKPTHEHAAQPPKNSTTPKTPELPNVMPGTKPANYTTPPKMPTIPAHESGHHQPSNSTKTPFTPVVEPGKHSNPPKAPDNSTQEPQKPTVCRKHPKARLPQPIKAKPTVPKYSGPLMEKWETYNFYK